MDRSSTRFLALTVSWLAAWNAAANGFRLPSQDAFATARGEAFVATADNASAVYYNPAGLSRLEGNNLRAGLYGIYLEPTYTAPDGAPNSGNTYHIEENLAAAPQIFYTHTPDEFPLSVGLGVFSPYGLSVSWPEDTGFRTVATDGAVTHITINPVAALKLLPTLSIGGGVTVNYSEIDLEQGLRTSQTPANSFRFSGDGWSVGYNLGLLWQPHEKVSLGASFRSSTTVTMEGETEFELLPFVRDRRQSAEMDFTFPLSAAFGISYRPTPKWNVEFNADYTDWSSLGTITIEQAALLFPLQKDIPLTLDWQPSWLYSLGVTRYFDAGWHMSAGYAFNENSVPDDNYTPLVADLDRHFFAVGIGWKGQVFNLDVAYQFGYGPTRTVTGSTPSTAGQIAGQTADGKYDFISHAVLLTVGVQF